MAIERYCCVGSMARFHEGPYVLHSDYEALLKSHKELLAIAQGLSAEMIHRRNFNDVVARAEQFHT